MKRPMPEEHTPLSEWSRIHDLPELRERSGIFRDRRHAGEILARMLLLRHGSGSRFVAYRHWRDVPELEVENILTKNCPPDSSTS